MANGNKQSVVLANNDIIYLWWSFPQKITNCLGFSIHRVIDDVEEATGLYATVGFDKLQDPRVSPQNTDQWPIQSFNWKDVYAPDEKALRYKIYPMVGTWNNLRKDETNYILTALIKKTQDHGDVQVIFNRGILSSQAFSKAGGTGKKITKSIAKKLITEPSSVWRKRLGGNMLSNVNTFFNKAKEEGGKYYAALYELTDAVLIKELTRNKGTEIILSNANSTISEMIDGKKHDTTVIDGTNKDTREKLHSINTIKVYDRIIGTHIGHNKFVIYVDSQGNPKSVLTGSTNWTPTGLCGQTNNMIIIDSEKVASEYKEYWDQMKLEDPLKDKDKQGDAFRAWCVSNSSTSKINGNADLTLWYSPNTVQKSKPANAATPVDMKYVFDLIENAKESVLYLVFNPGNPSIIEKIKEVAASRPVENPLFVRGAVSDAAIAQRVTTNIVSSDILKNPDTYYFDRVTGVAAIPGHFSYFEEELLKLGFSTIHDKILVIDPFSDQSVVITGSHNLGYAASYKNDENMVIIKNDKSIAQAYATHVLDVVNHFKWRYKLQSKILKAGAKTIAEKKAVLDKQWDDLDESDNWMNYYYNANGFINHNKFIF